MWNMKTLPPTNQKLWPRLKFCWRTDRQTDRGIKSDYYRAPAISGALKKSLGSGWKHRVGHACDSKHTYFLFLVFVHFSRKFMIFCEHIHKHLLQSSVHWLSKGFLISGNVSVYFSLEDAPFEVIILTSLVWPFHHMIYLLKKKTLWSLKW
jgi:hypothetical protein